MFQGQSGSDFATLINSLQMNASFCGAEVLLSQHLNRVQKLYVEFIQNEFVINPSIKTILAALPEESHVRLITSPYFCEFLVLASSPEKMAIDESKSVRAQLIGAIVAEMQRLQPDFMHPARQKWTINGDFVLDENLRNKFPPIHTACGIQLNYQSAIHNTRKAGIGGYDYPTALGYKSAIEKAKAIVAIGSSAAFTLIEEFTTIIQLRQNKGKPSVVNSSNHTSIGLIRCDNFHKLQTDNAELVDMLVHESIHQYLHLFEEQLFPFVKSEKILPGRINDRAFPSPWSGNLLDIRSYTHAILVWYGLVHFWGQLASRSFEIEGLARSQILEKLAEAQIGFVNCRSVLQNLGDSAQFLADDYVSVVTVLQKDLRQKVAV